MVTTYDKVLDTCYEVTTTVCAIMMVPVLVVVRLLASAPGESEPKAQPDPRKVVVRDIGGEVFIRFRGDMPSQLADLVMAGAEFSYVKCLCDYPCECDEYEDCDEYSPDCICEMLEDFMIECASKSDLCKGIPNDMIRKYGLCSVLAIADDGDGRGTYFSPYSLLHVASDLAYNMVRSGRVRSVYDKSDYMFALRECYGDWVAPPHEEVRPLAFLMGGLIAGYVCRANRGDITVGSRTWRPHRHTEICALGDCPFER